MDLFKTKGKDGDKHIHRFFDFQVTVTNLKQLNKNGEFVGRRKILHQIQSHILGAARQPPGWA